MESWAGPGNEANTHPLSSQKYATTGKNGEGVFARISTSSHAYMYVLRLLAMLCVRSTITMNATAFWKSGSFAEHVLQEISGVCVDTKLRGIK